NENALAVGAKKKPPLLVGADDRGGECVAAGGDRVDTLDRLVEAVGREAVKPILVGSGARRRHQGGEHAERTDERDEAIAEGTHPDRPGISERGGPQSGPPPFPLRTPRYVTHTTLRRATALLGHRIVIAALERHPVGLQILRAWQILGPGIARNQ